MQGNVWSKRTGLAMLAGAAALAAGLCLLATAVYRGWLLPQGRWVVCCVGAAAFLAAAIAARQQGQALWRGLIAAMVPALLLILAALCGKGERELHTAGALWCGGVSLCTGLLGAVLFGGKKPAGTGRRKHNDKRKRRGGRARRPAP